MHTQKFLKITYSTDHVRPHSFHSDLGHMTVHVTCAYPLYNIGLWRNKISFNFFLLSCTSKKSNFGLDSKCLPPVCIIRTDLGSRIMLLSPGISHFTFPSFYIMFLLVISCCLLLF